MRPYILSSSMAGITVKPLAVLDPKDYSLPELAKLSSPRLVVYRRRVEENIARMRRCLEEVAPGSGFRHLAPHVKTCKCAWATELLMRNGVERFKCTLNELDMLLAAGARDIFVAYPLLPEAAGRVARAVAENPGKRLFLQLASLAQAESMAAAARRHDVTLDCLVDLDVGNRRTGIPPALAPELVRQIKRSGGLSPLRVRGLHAYDGHNNSPHAAERQAEAERAMAAVARCALELERSGARVERVVVGGTPSFLPDLRELVGRHRLDSEVQGSPGTWTYWDTNYESKLPGMFVFAALLLARVMDLGSDGRLTLDLGHKRWAIDQGPLELFSVPGLQFAGASEEHTVLANKLGHELEYGEAILMAPRHVCPTVNLWENFTLVGSDGSIEAESLQVTARNR